MFLEKIEIYGFKSFAKRTVLEFENGITSIVGPNGSGKSNVADAVKWVLGEQSMKHIRGKKSGDIIFSGSKQKSRLGMAEVSLVLNNEDHAMPVDFDHVEITRRIYRGGDGEYILNKSKVRLLDILDLLAKSGFAQRTYGVIGQGMIDSLITSGSKDRLEIFEDASGVTQYKLKREHAVRKLERTSENMERVVGITAEVLPQLRSLKRQANRAKRREQVDAELSNAQVRLFSFQWAMLRKKDSNQQTSLHTMERARQSLENEISRLRKQIDKDKGMNADAQKQTRDIEQNIHAVQDSSNQIRAEIARIDGLISVELEQKSEVNISEMNYRVSVISDSLKGIHRNLTEIDRRIAEKKSELANQKQAMGVYIENRKKVRNQIEQIQHTRSEANDLDVQKRLQAIFASYNNFLHDIKGCTSIIGLQSLSDMGNRIHDELKNLLSELEENGSNSETETRIHELQEKMNSFINKQEQLSEKVHEIEISLTEDNTKRESLNEKSELLITEREELKKDLAHVQSSIKKGENAKLIQLQRKHAFLSKKLATFEKQEERLKDTLSQIQVSNQKQRESYFELERKERKKQDELMKQKDDINSVYVVKEHIKVELQELEKRIISDIGEKKCALIQQVQSDKIPSLSEDQMTELIERIERLRKKRDLIGGIDPQVIEEYEATQERYSFLTNQHEDLQKASESLRSVIAKLDAQIDTMFFVSFRKINEEFQKYFRMLFQGGSARLMLERSEDKQKSLIGVEIKATPPGKKLKNIHVLSGGEKALTSLSLLCAIMATNPSPFVVLDEVDSALDESNAVRFGDIMQLLSKKTQFITITHNRQTMKISKALYGVTMQTDGVSKLLSIKFDLTPATIQKQKKIVKPIEKNPVKVKLGF